MISNKKCKLLISIVLLVLLCGCSDKNSEHPSDIMWSDITTTSTSIENSETSKSVEDLADKNGIKISFLPNIFIDGADIEKVNIYKGKYHYDSDGDSMGDILCANGFKETNFSYDWYFSNETFNGLPSCPDYVLETIKSYQTFDLSDYDYFDGYKATGYVLPSSGWEDLLCDDDSLCSIDDFPSHDIPIYAIEKMVDDIPLGGWTFFSADSNRIFACEGVFDYSCFTLNHRKLFIKDGKLFLVQDGEFELNDILQENLPVIDSSTIKDVIIDDISKASFPITEATVYAIQLKYVPFVEFSIDKQEHVNYEAKDIFDDGNRQQIINADVYIVPVWEYSYKSVTKDYTYGNNVGYVNAVTGKPMFSDKEYWEIVTEEGRG